MSLKVFDFFSGCGGTSRGFLNAGLEPVFALDFDKEAGETFSKNFADVHFQNTDINQFNPTKLEDFIKPTDRLLFSGCAPCQPYTRQNTQKPDIRKDTRRSLLTRFGELIARYIPDYVFVENVPGIQRVAGNSTLSRFKKNLEHMGYDVSVDIVESQMYGVPQRRRRLVLLATRHGSITLPPPTHDPVKGQRYSTVREWIERLPPIEAGETHHTVPNHRAAKLSELNLERLRATPPEGSRASWPAELQLNCHAKNGYSGHTDVYGRMRWDAPATGLTTRCISLSNGRYGHPEQHRAISVREAASLQTFPEDFTFFGSLNSQARQIGNAVPVLLAEKFGQHILEHLERHVD